MTAVVINSFLFLFSHNYQAVSKFCDYFIMIELSTVNVLLKMLFAKHNSYIYTFYVRTISEFVSVYAYCDRSEM